MQPLPPHSALTKPEGEWQHFRADLQIVTGICCGPQLYFRVMDTKLEGLCCFPHKYTLQHPILQHLQYSTIPESGMLSSRTMFLDLIQLTYTATFSPGYWKDITEISFVNLTLSVKWFISGCIGTHITVATGISTVQRQRKMRVSVPKSLQRKFSISINTWKWRQSCNTSSITSQLEKQT